MSRCEDIVLSKEGKRVRAAEQFPRTSGTTSAAPELYRVLRSSTVFSSFETCRTTGLKIELPNAGTSVCLVTVPVIYQTPRRRHSLQAEPLPLI
jgi:hypothetical protein